jgi:hypothetical protein
MPALMRFVLLAVLLTGVWIHDARAEPKTVCTITVNSPDEKETLRRSLPRDDFRFVELVEHGRKDWLESACRKGVRCDVLLISGHFDDGTEFYSDRIGASDSLSTDELERVSCSDSCRGLFSELKEVYLFGCNTLQAQPVRNASGEITRSLIRSGYSPADAERLSQVLGERHGESNRDRMRLIFKGVPVIYGFSSKAPLGPIAASMLGRSFQSGSNSEIGTGRVNPRLLASLAPSSMTVASGLSDSDPGAALRRDVCHFSDDRLSTAQKLDFVHQLLDREMAEVRMFFDRIEKYAASLSEAERHTPAVAQVLDAIARDTAARRRYLEFARDADQPAVRARMIALARSLGWLSPLEERAELMWMIGDQFARDSLSSADVDLVCMLNRDHELDQELRSLQLSPVQPNKVAHAAVLACLGDTEAHARVVGALTSPDDEDVQIAQAYLQRHPIADIAELRGVATEIVSMNGSDAQVHALDTLARLGLADRESLEELARLFPHAKSLTVQRAIAGILVRSDFRAIATPDFVKTLRQTRLKSPDGVDVIDVLIRRLQAS